MLQFKSLYCFVSICTHCLLIGSFIYCICSGAVFYSYSLYETIPSDICISSIFNNLPSELYTLLPAITQPSVPPVPKAIKRPKATPSSVSTAGCSTRHAVSRLGNLPPSSNSTSLPRVPRSLSGSFLSVIPVMLDK